MNKTLKISLISLGVLGTGIGIYAFLRNKRKEGSSSVTYDNNIFKRVLNRLYQNDSFPLKLNSGGDRVKALQSFLNEEGSYGLVVDGKFGPLTLEAVKNQQSPFSNFKISFPNAVLGQVSEEYYNSFVKSSTGNNSSVEQSNLTNVVPTGGGNSGLQYAIDPSNLAFNGFDNN
ncbi:peptidoglycan-binding protein [Gammaproteobacteria bacterium]|nr:peptidoglycan-binding protein [Gammaproteobacteria bacterium]